MRVTESLLSGPDRLELEDGRQLRLLSAMEVLQARREGAALAQSERERALCSNACLLSRALERDGSAVFSSGGEVLRELTVEQIGTLARMWGQFNREVNPAPSSAPERVEALKKVWSARRRSGCSGACCAPSGPSHRRIVSER